MGCNTYQSSLPKLVDQVMALIGGKVQRRENMLGYLSTDVICYEKRTVFRVRSSKKTASFEEKSPGTNI